MASLASTFAAIRFSSSPSASALNQYFWQDRTAETGYPSSARARFTLSATLSVTPGLKRTLRRDLGVGISDFGFEHGPSESRCDSQVSTTVSARKPPAILSISP